MRLTALQWIKFSNLSWFWILKFFKHRFWILNVTGLSHIGSRSPVLILPHSKDDVTYDIMCLQNTCSHQALPSCRYDLYTAQWKKILNYIFSWRLHCPTFMNFGYDERGYFAKLVQLLLPISCIYVEIMTENVNFPDMASALSCLPD